MKYLKLSLAALTLLGCALAMPLFGDENDHPGHGDDDDPYHKGYPNPLLTTGVTRNYVIDIDQYDWTIRPGVTVKAWLFSDTVNPPRLPGPVIEANQGDLVRILFKNPHIKPHTLHFHGFHPEQADGVMPVEPEKSFLYEIPAQPYGTYVYHCHINTPVHQDRGMMGQYIVRTHLEPVVNKEFLLVIDEHPRDFIALGDDPVTATHEYLINGKAYDPNAPGKNIDVSRMFVRTGEKVRIRLSSFGFTKHRVKLEGHQLCWVFGSNPLGTPKCEDTPLILTNMSLNLTFTAGAPGTYRFYGVEPDDTKNNGVSPGGMQTELVVTP